MKLNNKKTTMNSLVTAIAALGFITVPVVHAQSGKPATDTNRSGTDNTQGGTGANPGGTGTGGTGTNRSGLDINRSGTGTNRTPLTSEVTDTFVDGYTVPAQYRTHFTEFPKNGKEDTVVRYHKGRAFHVNKEDWKIQQVVELDDSIKQEEEDTMFVQGYTIPQNLRTRFIDVPAPKEDESVRYYDNTAYYMDSDFKIVRTVDLTR